MRRSNGDTATVRRTQAAEPAAAPAIAMALAGMLARAVAMAVATAAALACLFLMAGVVAASPLEWQGDGRASAAPHLSSAVHLEVSGLIARVRLTQRFRNDRDGWVEGVYTFPLPAGAAVDELTMRYGSTVIEGEIREKAEAERVYREAREAGRRTVLVDRQRPNLFTTRLANVGPGETVEIEIAWQQTVDYDDGEYGLHLPLTLTPRYIPGRALEPGEGDRDAGTDQVPDAEAISPPFAPAMATRSDGHRLTLEGVIDAGVELAGVTGRYHPLRTAREGRAWRIGFDGRDVPMDRDLEIAWRPLPGAMPAATLFRGTGEAGARTWLLFFQPPHGEEPRGAPAPPRELVFVVDTSGSMHGASLEQAKAALSMALSRLRPEDRFNVIEFNSRTRAFFPAPVPGERLWRQEALELVADLAAEGGTEMEPALAAALRPGASGRLRQIVFITDGSVGNESALLELIRARLGESRLFTVAIGSAPNRWFMRKAAAAGRGSALVIGDAGEVSGRMERLFRRLERPALTDIAVDWPAGAAAEVYPAPVPDLYHGEPLMVSARFERPPPPGALVTVSGRQGDGYWMRQLVFDEARAYPGVGKLWARSRIEALEDARRAGAPEDRIRAEIVRTALDHHLVSGYTSLVAVDRSPSRPVGAGLQEGRVPSLLPRGQTAAVYNLPATGTPAPLRRMIGLVCLLLGLGLLVGLRVQDVRRCRAA
ncbi:marine proteobacterial sortase target protein [Lentisalinibacter orientalis]|uniref:marine proteobacterial sortase target protein n=1 Tax=Lentisalinibacter orientalis TaxID=2992241 RepID=UPI00386806EE